MNIVNHLDDLKEVLLYDAGVTEWLGIGYTNTQVSELFELLCTCNNEVVDIVKGLNRYFSLSNDSSRNVSFIAYLAGDAEAARLQSVYNNYLWCLENSLNIAWALTFMNKLKDNELFLLTECGIYLFNKYLHEDPSAERLQEVIDKYSISSDALQLWQLSSTTLYKVVIGMPLLYCTQSNIQGTKLFLADSSSISFVLRDDLTSVAGYAGTVYTSYANNLFSSLIRYYLDLVPGKARVPKWDDIEEYIIPVEDLVGHYVTNKVCIEDITIYPSVFGVMIPVTPTLGYLRIGIGEDAGLYQYTTHNGIKEAVQIDSKIPLPFDGKSVEELLRAYVDKNGGSLDGDAVYQLFSELNLTSKKIVDGLQSLLEEEIS